MFWYLLQLIPDNIIETLSLSLFVIGVFGAILVGTIPIFPYKSAVHLLSILCIISGTYMYSGYDIESHWRKELEKANQEIKTLTEKSKIVTVEVVTVYKDRIKVIKEKSKAIKHEISNQITKKSNDICKLSNSFIRVHDISAKNEIPNPSTRVDESPSGVDLSSAAEVITSNYEKYHEVSQQLKSLQSWIREQEKAINE